MAKIHQRCARPTKSLCILVVGLMLAGRSLAQEVEFVVEELDGLGGLTNVSLASCLADVDQDGLTDLVLGWAILWGEGYRRFSFVRQELEGSFSRGLAVADLDQDGLPDIATGDLNSFGVHWNLGNRNLGNRRFDWQVIDRVHGGNFLQVVDVNRDGAVDLISSGRESPGLSWVQFEGRKPIIHRISDSFWRPFSALAGNLDEDDDNELVISTGDGYFLMDWQNSETPPGGEFVNAVCLEESTTGRHLALVDWDLDGRTDIVHTGDSEERTAELVLLTNEGNLTFARTVLLTTDRTGGYFRWVEATDVDGDGDPDLVTSKWTNRPGKIWVLLNQGGGAFTTTKLEYEEIGMSMHTFSLWPFEDGRKAILPGTAVRLPGDPFPIIYLRANELAAEVYRDGGSLKISWSSRSDYDYRLQFSLDLDSWSDSYQSSGEPVTVDSLIGTGSEMTHTLAEPDERNLYVRVIGGLRSRR